MFFSFFSFWLCITSRVCLGYNLTLHRWDFHGFHSFVTLSFSITWSDSMCKVHIALQELQAVALMLCRMAVHLSCKVVALNLCNGTTKTYLCNQSDTVLFPRLACHNLDLADTTWYYTYSSILTYPSWYGSQLPVMRKVSSRVASSSLQSSGSLSVLRSIRGGSVEGLLISP